MALIGGGSDLGTNVVIIKSYNVRTGSGAVLKMTVEIVASTLWSIESKMVVKSGESFWARLYLTDKRFFSGEVSVSAEDMNLIGSRPLRTRFKASDL